MRNHSSRFASAFALAFFLITAAAIEDANNVVAEGTWVDMDREEDLPLEHRKLRLTPLELPPQLRLLNDPGSNGGTFDVTPVFNQTNTPLDPDTTCKGFNDPSTGLNCVCSQSGKLDVFVDCDYLNLLCASDNTTCYRQRFTSILDAETSPRNGVDPFLASRVTSCAQQVTKETATPVGPYGEACVEIQPVGQPGSFNESVICGASLDGKICRSCRQCNNNEMVQISVDCCNSKADAYMTCATVGSGGGITPVFDPPGTHKNCVPSGSDMVYLNYYSSSWIGGIMTMMMGLLMMRSLM